MNLKEMWKKYLELWNEGEKLWGEGEKLYDKNVERGITPEVAKFYRKSDDTRDEGYTLLHEFLIKSYGKEIKLRYRYDRIILSNGVILYFNGDVYEPLEVVMKEIIKKHEEEELEKTKKS